MSEHQHDPALGPCPACGSTAKEPTRIITVRMPTSVHERIKKLSHASETSMNQFCVNALLAAVTPKPE